MPRLCSSAKCRGVKPRPHFPAKGRRNSFEQSEPRGTDSVIIGEENSHRERMADPLADRKSLRLSRNNCRLLYEVRFVSSC